MTSHFFPAPPTPHPIQLLFQPQRQKSARDAVVQVGWRLELTPLQAGKRCGQSCPELKLRRGGVESRKSDGPKGRVKDQALEGGGDMLSFKYGNTFLGAVISSGLWNRAG